MTHEYNIPVYLDEIEERIFNFLQKTDIDANDQTSWIMDLFREMIAELKATGQLVEDLSKRQHVSDPPSSDAPAQPARS